MVGSPIGHHSSSSSRRSRLSATRRSVRSASATMTISRRVTDGKILRFEKNITKRGSVPETVKKGNDYPVGPILLGFFVFVVVGSSLFQIIKTATSSGIFRG